MKLYERKILAMTECLLLWDRLAETGNLSKVDVIRKLQAEGLLSDAGGYTSSCPLCHYLIIASDKGTCKHCPWPRKANEHGRAGDDRCCADESPYMLWCYASKEEELKEAARAVLDMLLAAEF